MKPENAFWHCKLSHMRFEPLQFGTKTCMFQLTGHHKTICVKEIQVSAVCLLVLVSWEEMLSPSCWCYPTSKYDPIALLSATKWLFYLHAHLFFVCISLYLTLCVSSFFAGLFFNSCFPLDILWHSLGSMSPACWITPECLLTVQTLGLIRPQALPCYDQHIPS